MLSAKDNAAIVRSVYDSFNDHDVAKVLPLLSEDVKWTNVAFGTTFSGPKGYREFFEGWSTAMPDCRVEIVNLIGGDEWTIAECVGRGTHTGPLTGPSGTFAPTQQKLELRFCEIYRMMDGQIREGRVYFDAATLMRQLGSQPQPQTSVPALAPQAQTSVPALAPVGR